jgi:hypothetical protein
MPQERNTGGGARQKALPTAASKVRTSMVRDANGVVRTRSAINTQASKASRSAKPGQTLARSSGNSRQVIRGAEPHDWPWPRSAPEAVTYLTAPAKSSNGSASASPATGKRRYFVNVRGNEYVFHSDRALSREERQIFSIRYAPITALQQRVHGSSVRGD